MNLDRETDEPRLTAEAERETSRGDVPGGETWPMADAPSMGTSLPPPVGLNWTGMADALGVDVDVLRHDGTIVVLGDTFPEDGYLFDPSTFRAQRVDVGQRALGRGYFLGRVACDTHGLRFEVEDAPPLVTNPVLSTDRAPVIALFADRSAAERARELVLRGSLGSGLALEDGPLGTEVTVGVTDLPGRVATTLASVGGAILSIGGQAIRRDSSPALASGASGDIGDARRGGTGVAGDVPGPEATSPRPGRP